MYSRGTHEQASTARLDRLAIGPQVVNPVANLPHMSFHQLWRGVTSAVQRKRTFTSGLFSRCVVSTNRTRAGVDVITIDCV